MQAERGPLPRLARGRDGSPVIGHHLLADGQTDARTGEFAFAVQPLEDLKSAAAYFSPKPIPLSATSMR